MTSNCLSDFQYCNVCLNGLLDHVRKNRTGRSPKQQPTSATPGITNSLSHQTPQARQSSPNPPTPPGPSDPWCNGVRGEIPLDENSRDSTSSGSGIYVQSRPQPQQQPQTHHVRFTYYHKCNGKSRNMIVTHYRSSTQTKCRRSSNFKSATTLRDPMANSRSLQVRRRQLSCNNSHK